MVTIMIVSQKNKINEAIVSSIVGGLEYTVNIISTTDPLEAEEIIISEKYDIDLFILQVKMKPKSSTVLESIIREKKCYATKPVLLLTNLSYNMVGYPQLAGYESYKHKNYISMPLERTDVQAKLCLYLDEILQEQQEHQKNYIFIEHQHGEILLEQKNILYAEVQNKLLTIHSTSGAFEIKRATLGDFCQQAGSECFIQCHKSFVININAVVELQKYDRRNWVGVFENGARCPVSQTYYNEVKKKYMKRMTTQGI